MNTAAALAAAAREGHHDIMWLLLQGKTLSLMPAAAAGDSEAYASVLIAAAEGVKMSPFGQGDSFTGLEYIHTMLITRLVLTALYVR